MNRGFLRFGLLNWIGLAMSAAAIAWLAHGYDFGEMLAPLREAEYARLPLVLVLVVANFILRAIRWRALLHHPDKPGVGLFFRMLMIGYLFNVILPARAGDLVRAYEMGRRGGLAKGKVLATLAVERLGDLLCLLAILAGVLLAYPALPTWAGNAGVAVAVAAVCLGGGMLFMRIGGGALFLRMLNAMRAKLGARLHDRLHRLMESFISGLAVVDDMKTLANFAALTGALWLLEVLIFQQVALAVGLQIPAGNALFIILAVTIGTLVPSSPGFIGTYEYFGVAALGLVGVSGSIALTLIVAQHALVLLVPSLLGAGCLAGSPGVISDLESEQQNGR